MPQEHDAKLAAPETETIGRLPHLLAHVTAQLSGMAAGEDRFDDVRARYGQTMSALASRGLARVTAPRAGIGTNYRYWSSTRDVIKEFQTLGWVQDGLPVPSTRGAVDAHRDRHYPLTPTGLRVAEQASSRIVLADLLTDALLRAHPYVRTLLEALKKGSIFCPEVGEGQVQRDSGRRHWAEHAAELFAPSDAHVTLTADELESRLAGALRRRFGSRRAEGLKPTPKEVAEALSDAFADASLSARGLHFGATTLDQLKSWGTELRLLDQSRYVPGHEGGNLIWLTCDLALDGEGGPRARRKPYTEHGKQVAQALVQTYFALRERRAGDADAGATEYQPIHVVRAGAAAATSTARELGDRALEAMAAGQLDAGVQVRLLSARGELAPRSEPTYQRGGTRALTLTMTRHNGGSQTKSASARNPQA
jgi:hypothetical protein